MEIVSKKTLCKGKFDTFEDVINGYQERRTLKTLSRGGHQEIGLWIRTKSVHSKGITPMRFFLKLNYKG